MDAYNRLTQSEFEELRALAKRKRKDAVELTTRARKDAALARRMRKDADAIELILGLGHKVVTGIDQLDCTIIRICRDYYATDSATKREYSISDRVIEHDRLIPYRYIYKRAERLGAFRSATFGAKAAIESTLYRLVAAGTLVEIPRDKAIKELGIKAQLYILQD